jgi:DNA-binding NarL/FixJ family response regulator
MSRIVIIDSDLGFAFWLGHVLDQAGDQALPAASVAHAKSLLAELGIVADLVVINTGAPDAAAFIADLRAARPRCRVIALVDNDNPPANFPCADLVEHKAMLIDESSRADWVDTVRIVLSAGALPM